MPGEEPDDNDAQFLEYLSRLGGKWTGLQELVNKAVTEALKSGNHAPAGSDSYLARQNQILLDKLFEKQGLSTPVQPGQTPTPPTQVTPPEPSGNTPVEPTQQPKPQPRKSIFR